MSEIIPINDIERMAQVITKAKFFGYENIEQAATLMFIAQAEGRHPASAAKEYHIIKGRPALKADAMLARYQHAGGKVQWIERTDTKVSAKFIHPQSGEVPIEWTFDYAKRAGLVNGDNWRKYPRQMLSARVISEGVRASFPSVVCGIYTPEEVEAFDELPKETPKISKPKFAEKPAEATLVEPPKQLVETPTPVAETPTTVEEPKSDIGVPIRDQLWSMLEEFSYTEADVFKFLLSKMTPAQLNNASRIADLPDKVVERLVEKFNSVIEYVQTN